MAPQVATEYSTQSNPQTRGGTNGYQHYAPSYHTNPRKRPLSYLDRLDQENGSLWQRLETSQNTIRVLRKDVRYLTHKTRRLEQERSSTLTENPKPPARYDILMLAGDLVSTSWKQLKKAIRTEFKEHEASEKDLVSPHVRLSLSRLACLMAISADCWLPAGAPISECCPSIWMLIHYRKNFARSGICFKMSHSISA